MVPAKLIREIAMPHVKTADSTSKPIRVLFVCTGNICRSPTAEGVFRRLVAEAGLEGVIEVDSAGTHDYHVGEAPDSRTIAAARARGVALDHLRGRQATTADFRTFDLVVAMDRGHRRILYGMRPTDARGELALFLDFAPDVPMADVPDPYFGGPEGFEQVLDMIESGARGLLDHIRKTML